MQKLNPKLKLILGISALIVLVVIVVTFFITVAIRKKILKKHYLLDNEKQLQAFAAKNPNYGIVLEGIKKYYSTPLVDDLLVAFLVNTIFVNKYQSIYLLDKNDYLAISLSILLSKDVNLEKNKNFESKLTEIKNNTEIDLSNLNIKDTILDEKQKYDILISLSDYSNIIDIVNKYLNNFNSNTMLVLEYNSLKDIKELKNIENIRYETISFNKRNFILLAKDNLHDKLLMQGD